VIAVVVSSSSDGSSHNVEQDTQQTNKCGEGASRGSSASSTVNIGDNSAAGFSSDNQGVIRS
jgi:hypothetical protein